MNDNTMIPAIVLAAGVATAGGLAYCEPSDYENNPTAAKTSLRFVAEESGNKTFSRIVDRENLGWFRFSRRDVKSHL